MEILVSLFDRLRSLVKVSRVAFDRGFPEFSYLQAFSSDVKRYVMSRQHANISISNLSMLNLVICIYVFIYMCVYMYDF